MMKKSLISNNTSNKDKLRSRYLEGNLSLDEYVNRLLNSKEGDRNRRNLERKTKDLLLHRS